MRSKRIVVTGKGGPDVLKLVEDDICEPGGGEIRIRVEAAGVAIADTMRRRGVLAPRRPFTPGYDVVGCVDAAGEGVEGIELDTRVAAMMPTLGQGGYSEHVIVPAKPAVRVPKSIEGRTTAALCVRISLNDRHRANAEPETLSRSVRGPPSLAGDGVGRVTGADVAAASSHGL